MADDLFDARLRQRLRVLEESIPVPSARSEVDRQSAPRVRIRSSLPGGALAVGAVAIGLLAVIGLSGRPTSSGGSPSVTATPAASVTSAAVVGPSAAALLPAGGISAASAETAARDHVLPDAVLVGATAGQFADVYSPAGNGHLGPGYPVKPSDLVWAVTFDEQIVICPPPRVSAGHALPQPCLAPRPATVTVILDYVTGTFRSSATYAPGP